MDVFTLVFLSSYLHVINIHTENFGPRSVRWKLGPYYSVLSRWDKLKEQTKEVVVGEIKKTEAIKGRGFT